MPSTQKEAFSVEGSHVECSRVEGPAQFWQCLKYTHNAVWKRPRCMFKKQNKNVFNNTIFIWYAKCLYMPRLLFKTIIQKLSLCVCKEWKIGRENNDVCFGAIAFQSYSSSHVHCNSRPKMEDLRVQWCSGHLMCRTFVCPLWLSVMYMHMIEKEGNDKAAVIRESLLLYTCTCMYRWSFWNCSIPM